MSALACYRCGATLFEDGAGGVAGCEHHPTPATLFADRQRQAERAHELALRNRRNLLRFRIRRLAHESVDQFVLTTRPQA